MFAEQALMCECKRSGRPKGIDHGHQRRAVDDDLLEKRREGRDGARQATGIKTESSPQGGKTPRKGGVDLRGNHPSENAPRLEKPDKSRRSTGARKKGRGEIPSKCCREHARKVGLSAVRGRSKKQPCKPHLTRRAKCRK